MCVNAVVVDKCYSSSSEPFRLFGDATRHAVGGVEVTLLHSLSEGLDGKFGKFQLSYSVNVGVHVGYVVRFVSSSTADIHELQSDVLAVDRLSMVVLAIFVVCW